MPPLPALHPTRMRRTCCCTQSSRSGTAPAQPAIPRRPAPTNDWLTGGRPHGPAPLRLCPQAGSHFDEDQQHLEAGGKAVQFAKLPASEEEASGSAIKAGTAAAAADDS